MKVAVAKRPVEKFDTEVTLPEWQLEPDEEAYYEGPDNGAYAGGMMVDENGYPIEPPASAPSQGYEDEPDMEVDPQDRPQPPRLDQQWIDNVLGRDPARQPAQQPPSNRPPSQQP